MTWQSLCWKHIIRNKKNWYYLFFFSFFTLLIQDAFTFYQIFVYNIQNTITKNIDFKNKLKNPYPNKIPVTNLLKLLLSYLVNN